MRQRLLALPLVFASFFSKTSVSVKHLFTTLTHKTAGISGGNVRLRIQRIKANVRYFGRFGASSRSDIFDQGQVQQLCLLQKTQKHKQ